MGNYTILDNAGNPMGSGHSEELAKQDVASNLDCSINDIERFLSLPGFDDDSLHFASISEI